MMRWLKGAVVVASTAVVAALGGWDIPLQALVVFVALAYGTAVLRARVERRFASSIGLRGLVRKLAIFLGIVACHQLDVWLFAGQPWARTVAVCTAGLNEVGSLTGHLAVLGVPLPEPVLKALAAEIERKRGGREA